jgi:hypothetical protein
MASTYSKYSGLGGTGGGGGSGANTTLSNLTSPTAVNQDLLPGTTYTESLGNASSFWDVLYVGTVEIGYPQSTSGAVSQGLALTLINDSVSAIGLQASGENDGYIQFASSAGTVAAPSATQSGDNLGTILFTGYGATQWSTANVPSLMSAVATENWTNTANGVSLQFSTTINGSTNNNLFIMGQDGSFSSNGINFLLANLSNLAPSTATPASGAGTLLNLPAGASGNPTWLSVTVNGVAGVIPFWPT